MAQQKEMHITSRGVKDMYFSSEAKTEELSQQQIIFDPTTGKKVQQTTVKSKMRMEKKELTVKEQWEEERQQRIISLTKLKKTEPTLLMQQSPFFQVWRDDVMTALIQFEECRTQLDLNFESASDRCVWRDPNLACWFLFGIGCEKLGPLPEHLAKNQTLACLWTWEEMVEFGKQPHFVTNYIQQVGLALDPAKRTGGMFLVTPMLVADFIQGCLLYPHIKQLETLMRPEIKSFAKNPECFPSLESIRIPPTPPNISEEEPLEPTSAIFRYSFSLQNPRLKLPHELGMCCQKDGFTAINFEGPFAALVCHEGVKNGLFSKFESVALKDSPPAAMRQQATKLMNKVLEDECIV